MRFAAPRAVALADADNGPYLNGFDNLSLSLQSAFARSIKLGGASPGRAAIGSGSVFRIEAILAHRLSFEGTRSVTL